MAEKLECPDCRGAVVKAKVIEIGLLVVGADGEWEVDLDDAEPIYNGRSRGYCQQDGCGFEGPLKAFGFKDLEDEHEDEEEEEEEEDDEEGDDEDDEDDDDDTK